MRTPKRKFLSGGDDASAAAGEKVSYALPIRMDRTTNTDSWTAPSNKPVCIDRATNTENFPPSSKEEDSAEKMELMVNYEHWLLSLLTAFGGLAVGAALLCYVVLKRRKTLSDLSAADAGGSTLTGISNTKSLTALKSLSPTEQKQSPSLLSFIPKSVCHPLHLQKIGLLERRGSSASLTLDLDSEPSQTQNSPSLECSAEEYLLSASKRLSRTELQNSARRQKDIMQQFLEIPLNHATKPKLEALPAGCSNKNRYKSVLPNPCSRVVLECEDEDGRLLANVDRLLANASQSDPVVTASYQCSPEHYINANYVRGYDGEQRSFIATQGPLTNTVDDFWRMVWQQRCRVIVMMTKLKEQNKWKCDPYLPSGQQASYGGIRVLVRSTAVKDGYSVRELLLQRAKECRSVKHFWFAAWPDHKAPASTVRQVLAMANQVEQAQEANKSPLVVHCSAGIGRTGCFIGLCIGMKQLREENAVDILAIVCQMRLDRGGMIQNPEQYEFLHHALALYERFLPAQSCDTPPLNLSALAAETSDTLPGE